MFAKLEAELNQLRIKKQKLDQEIRALRRDPMSNSDNYRNLTISGEPVFEEEEEENEYVKEAYIATLRSKMIQICELAQQFHSSKQFFQLFIPEGEIDCFRWGGFNACLLVQSEDQARWVPVLRR